MNNISVSIIIPVYNVGAYIEDCIRSVMLQTYTGPMECIVVDDCGTDNSIDIVEERIAEYKGSIAFSIARHDHNRGLSAARNTGMDVATGEYFLFLDGDDELTADCIETLTVPLKEERYDVVVGNFDVVLGEGISFYQGRILRIPDNAILYDEEILNAYKSKLSTSTVWNKLYSSKAIHESGIRFKEGIMEEDVLWEFEMACSMHTMYCVNQITYLYRRRMGSLMTTSGVDVRAHSYLIRFIEMCKFIHDKAVDYVLVHDVLVENHHHALKYYRNSREVFIQTYNDMRLYFRPSLSKIMKGNHCRLIKCIRDIHFVLPGLIAPYWCYYVNYHLRVSLSRNRKA